MARDDVQEYINQLRAIANYETADLKARLTEKLLHIIDETSTANIQIEEAQSYHQLHYVL